MLLQAIQSTSLLRNRVSAITFASTEILLQKPGFLIPSAIALDASPSYRKGVKCRYTVGNRPY
ncbi:MAG: hypothetical protein JGK17_07910 [Microcoleus sp. PH2017_10_PVI_O_A]|uniref:hypothetical protein n=1 Tax=Microcoleus sp. PH2017_10_PVI_O_A TaxID=2798821 RepID=UPI001D832845|nr:hypothetical protein [Microcoleus sp. PH2017_10_PVI_O_A]MCC3405507.1 hypothetical protein [Microcoleus sp. PH2017_10_PVI_O_A]MCC3461712.1 hypothetical protein [Microcoleus sp. PH2017_11_PCY_U_A]MCC3558633.1 hypothetical protein [Microcoleus sp. PH2017_27_LUM_O_A]